MRKKKVQPLSREDQIFAKELIQKLNATIYGVVRSYLDDDFSSDFEDIVQSVYEEICTQLGDFRRCDSQKALATVIAARKVWHIQRDRRPTEVLTDDVPAPEANRGLEDILPLSISDKDREILTSVYVAHDTMVELSADLGCPPETLRQRLKRAKARLKQSLEEDT